jgi:TolC family type I secretion outer membrane protein
MHPTALTRRVFLPAVLLIFLSHSAQATSLNEALAAAYAGNPTLDARRAELRAVDEGVPQALSGWRPTIEGRAQGGREWDDVNEPIPFDQKRWPRSYGVAIRQPIFEGFGTVASTAQAEKLVQAGRFRLLDTEQVILLNAVSAYMAVVRDEAVLQLNINNEKVLAKQLEATQARFKAGEVTKTDVAQAEARLQGAVAGRIQAEGQLTASRAFYREVIGDEPVDVQMPSAALELPASRDEAVTLSENAPTVRAAEFEERAANDDIDVQFSDLLPTVAIEGAYERQEDIGLEDSEADVGSIIGQVVIPLYQAGEPDSRVRQSKQRYMRSKRLTSEARRAAERESITAWQAVQTAFAQTVSFGEQVRANELALEGVRREQEVGARTILDILDAEQELLDSRVSLVASQTDEVVARHRLLAAVGALTAVNLGLDVEYYDPAKHYRAVRNKIIGTGPSVE